MMIASIGSLTLEKKRGRVNALVILIIIKKYYLERIAIVIMYIDIRVSLVGVGVDVD